MEKVNKQNNQHKNDFSPSEKLTMLCIIVSSDQTDFYVDKLTKMNVNAVYNILGTGSASKEIYHILNINYKKSLIIGLVKESLLKNVLDFIDQRFLISKQAKGVAFTIKVDSMIGVLLYKFLINQKTVIKKKKDKKEKSKGKKR